MNNGYGFYFSWTIKGAKSSASVQDSPSLKEAMDWVCGCAESDGIVWRKHWWQFWLLVDPRYILKAAE